MIKVAAALINISISVLLLVTVSFSDENLTQNKQQKIILKEFNLEPNVSGSQGETSLQSLKDGPFRKLWEQPWQTSSYWIISNQDYETAKDSEDTFLADDFFVSGHWTIHALSVPAITQHTCDSCCLSDATKLNFMIYKDNDTFCPWLPNPEEPDGYPGGGNPPIWSVSILPSDPQLDIFYEYDDGTCCESYIGLLPTTPVELERGSYWLVFYPELDSSCGDAYRITSSSIRGYDGQIIFPHDASPTWLSFHDYFSINHQDLVFTLWGTSTGGSNPAVDLLLLGD